jgi:hypothetical protein
MTRKESGTFSEVEGGFGGVPSQAPSLLLHIAYHESHLPLRGSCLKISSLAGKVPDAVHVSPKVDTAGVHDCQ